MKTLTIPQVEYIASRLAREKLYFDEREVSERFPHILESCLVTPFQKSSRRLLYPSLVAKAGILFYLMIKNRPFQEGNRRIAVTTLLVFLHKNNKWLKADIGEFYNFTVWVAQSPVELKRQVVSGIELFIRTHLVNL
jgi:prophage maintenance system killer protein